MSEMSTGDTPQMPEAMSPSEFWDFYFASQIKSGVRTPIGEYRVVCPPVPKGKELIPSSPPRRAELSRDAMVGYDYMEDPRFGLGLHHSLAGALEAVVGAPVMENETIPQHAELRFAIELLGQPRPDPSTEYPALRELVLRRLEDARCTAASVGDAMSSRLPTETDRRAYEESGRIAELHAERELVYKAYALHTTDPAATEQLLACLANKDNDDVQTLQVVVWSLGRHNDKGSIRPLLAVLADEESPFLHGLAQQALQRLCSGEQLIELADSDRAVEHWSAVERSLPNARNTEAWVRRDAGSFFWEKRQRAAQAAGQDVRLRFLLGELAEDEVLQVRETAAAVREQPEDTPRS